MTVNSSVLDIIILLGAVQGFIISVLLYLKKEKIYANRFLAVIIFLIALSCLNIFLLDIHLTNHSTVLTIVSVIVPFVVIMPIGPLIYFYTKSILPQNFKLTFTDRIHFYPVILDLIPSIVGIAAVIGALLNWIPKSERHHWGNFLDQYNTYVDLPRWISVFVYTCVSWKLKNLRTSESQSWPKQFIIGFFIFEAIWLLHLIPYVIPSLSNRLLDGVGWYPVYIPLTVMVYWLGLNGYLRIQPQIKSSIVLEAELVNKVTNALRKAMKDDRLYLKAELNLNDVVKHTGIPQKTISAVLNQHLGKSFNEFVNGFRIAEVKKRLLEPGNGHLTITGIALECGFNSQATFQRTFKQFTGQSPREFQQTGQ